MNLEQCRFSSTENKRSVKKERDFSWVYDVKSMAVMTKHPSHHAHNQDASFTWQHSWNILEGEVHWHLTLEAAIIFRLNCLYLNSSDGETMIDEY